jgi:hypothetical protein
MENSLNKLIELAGDKASQVGFYWFLDRMVGYAFYLIFWLLAAYVLLKIVKYAQEMDMQAMRLQEQKRIDQIARNILSDQEYRNRFKNWPKISIEEQDKI